MVGGRGAPTDRLPPAFHRLIVAWAASLTADGLRVVVLPLLTVTVDPSPAAVAVVAAVTAAPWLLIAIPAGALVDRLDPVRVMAVAHVVRAALIGALIGFLVADALSITVLCVVGFAATTAETFADGAAQSLVVRVVGPEQLERANARFVTTETTALDLVGPIVGGLLFTVSPTAAFAACATAYLVGAVVVTTVRAPTDPRPVAAVATSEQAAPGPSAPTDAPAESASGDRAAGVRRGMADGVRSGLRVLWRDRALRTLVSTVAVLALANAAADAMLVLYATDELRMPETFYAFMLAAYSVGTLVASFGLPWVASRYRGGPVMFVAVLGMGGSLLAVGFLVHPAAALLGYTVLGLAQGTWNVLSAARRQRRTPRDMIARVSSAFRVVAWGVLPLGATAGGAVAERWGVPAVFVAAGGLTLLAAVAAARSLLAPEPPARAW
ncbi:MFS transporter [Nakamurella leprariae]|uniref:MFS transporter n=1 Tax=Nakamurella leprariae TaxID=2803911 RepID=A0A938YCM3_9ACTN|nr:MFS transporter [Nakamurella leprariae]MBM9467158.1 MFS transporter [Nakamurella leprariae]